MVEPTGYTALDMIGFTDKGSYDPLENYVKNDIVHDADEKMWRCKVDDTRGVTPAEGVSWTKYIAPPVANPETIGIGYGTCSTAASTTAKEATLSGYNLKQNGYVSVLFTYAVPASATLNVNSKGAKPIYYHGSAITADIIGAGDLATFVYDGTNYNLVGVDNVSSQIQALANDVSTNTSNITSLQSNKADKVLVITLPNVSTSKLSFTHSDVAAISDVTGDHVVVESVLSNPSAQLSDWTITTNTDSIIVSGTVARGVTTNLTLTLIQKA